MVSVPEANSIILAHLFKPRKEKVSLVLSTGRILAESIKADHEFPPFDRVTMDGIAVRSAEINESVRSFKITGTQPAGQSPINLAGRGNCVEVMTGAVLPGGADTVVPYEDIEIKDGMAHIRTEQVTKGENIHYKGMDAKENSILLTAGIRISPAEVALMAAVGRSDVKVFAGPRTAIISTGDELVPIHQVPLPHQIRISNSYALQAALQELNCPASLFHIRDQKETLENELSRILGNHELIVLSGGASKGKFDYVPEVLETLGVKKLFYKVTQKPGKPFWFGIDKSHTVFALPGNPVSTYMCFYRYIRPWLMNSLGAQPPAASAILATAFSFKPALTYFLQVKIQHQNGKLMAYPDPGGGSGDFANLKDVDGFLELPAERTDFSAGEVFAFFPFRI